MSAGRPGSNRTSRTSNPWRAVPVPAKHLAEWLVWSITRRSTAFWELHYRARGTSGPGSRGESAEFKADHVNRIVAAESVESVLEFGCGDGYQLGLLSIPRYIGMDVSASALRRCIDQYRADSTKSFLRYDPSCWQDNLRLVHADMTLSMDVIIHLVEDDVFQRYMTHLFAAADRLVVVYSTNEQIRARTRFTRHRCFTQWVAANQPGWRLSEQVNNPDGSGAGMYLFRRAS
jgi:cyclopropane fatty-acyl-phospholipid synthase-like methyltransferase